MKENQLLQRIDSLPDPVPRRDLIARALTSAASRQDPLHFSPVTLWVLSSAALLMVILLIRTYTPRPEIVHTVDAAPALEQITAQLESARRHLPLVQEHRVLARDTRSPSRRVLRNRLQSLRRRAHAVRATAKVERRSTPPKRDARFAPSHHAVSTSVLTATHQQKHPKQGISA